MEKNMKSYAWKKLARCREFKHTCISIEICDFFAEEVDTSWVNPRGVWGKLYPADINGEQVGKPEHHRQYWANLEDPVVFQIKRSSLLDERYSYVIEMTITDRATTADVDEAIEVAKDFMRKVNGKKLG